jgi:hypothetical protein
VQLEELEVGLQIVGLSTIDKLWEHLEEMVGQAHQQFKASRTPSLEENKLNNTQHLRRFIVASMYDCTFAGSDLLEKGPNQGDAPMVLGNKLFTEEVFDLLLRSLNFVDIVRGTGSDGEKLSVVSLVFNKGEYNSRGILSSNADTNRRRMTVNLKSMLKKKCPNNTDVLMDIAIITVETRAGLGPQQLGSIVDGKIVSDSKRKYNGGAMGDGDDNSDYGDRSSSTGRQYSKGDHKDDYYREYQRQDRSKRGQYGDPYGEYDRGQSERSGRGARQRCQGRIRQRG